MYLFDNSSKGLSHPSWQALKNGTGKENEICRAMCNELYKRFELYADSDFIKKFKIEFFPQFWEMDLACALMDIGMVLSPPDSGDAGPDLCITKLENKKLWIEATCPQKGNEEDRVPEYVSNKANRVPSEKIILRITNAIDKKYTSHQKYLEKGICLENEPYVIAINGDLLTPGPGLDDLTPRIVKAVFEGGSDIIHFDKNSGNMIETYCENKQSIQKYSNKPVSLGYFLQKKYANISAVIYSESSYNTRTTEPGGDFILVHNPLAINPVQEGLFKMGREYICKKPFEPEELLSLSINNYTKEKYPYSVL